MKIILSCFTIYLLFRLIGKLLPVISVVLVFLLKVIVIPFKVIISLYLKFYDKYCDYDMRDWRKTHDYLGRKKKGLVLDSKYRIIEDNRNKLNKSND